MIFVILCVVLSYIIAILFAFKYRFAALALLTAVSTRVGLFFINDWGVYRVPGAGRDAANFIRRSAEVADLPWANLVSMIEPSKGGTNYSILGGSIVKLVGHDAPTIAAVNLVFATLMLSVVLVLVFKIWGKRAAVAAILVLAFYPFSLFNSVIALREEVSSLFGILGAAAVIYWSRNGVFYFLYLAAAFFLLAASFHPGWSGALVGLAAFSLWRSTQIVRLATAGHRVSRYEFSLVMSAVIFVSGVAILLSLPGFSLLSLFDGYVGEDADIGDAITARFAREEALGGSGYPSFITHGDPMTQPWLIPLRIFYFLFSPFPWDIRSPRHVLGLSSSLLYMFIFWKLYKHWDQVKQHKELIPIIFIFAGLTFVFAVGVTNIGTAIRHKTKFLPILLLFGAVAFHNLRIRFGR